MSSDDTLIAPSEIIERAIRLAKSDLVVVVEEEHDAYMRFANNTTTTNGLTRDRRVSAISFSRRRTGCGVGVISRSGAIDVTSLVKDAESLAASAPDSEDESPLVIGEARDNSFGDEAQESGPEAFSNVAAELMEGFDRARAKSEVLSGFMTHETTTTYLGSTKGVARRHVESSGSLEVVARADEGARSSWKGVATTDFDDVSLLQMYDRLTEELTYQKRRIELPVGRYEVVLPPDAVADLVIELGESLSGQEAQDGASPFSRRGGGTRVGDVLSRLPFLLRSDPNHNDMSTSPFLSTTGSGRDVSVFDNGSVLSPVDWIKDGRLNALRYHRAGARRYGVDFAPPGENLVFVLPGATKSTKDLVGETRRGLLLTCLWYIREVDPATLLLTGLTRDGVYLIEGGEIVGAVNNFRFNESPLLLLDRVIDAGKAVAGLSREWGEWMRKTEMAPLRVADFNMSSLSEAS